jgi:hypothetical protein
MHLIEPHIQLICSNDGEGRQNALSQLYLAGEHTHKAWLRKI